MVNSSILYGVVGLTALIAGFLGTQFTVLTARIPELLKALSQWQDEVTQEMGEYLDREAKENPQFSPAPFFQKYMTKYAKSFHVWFYDIELQESSTASRISYVAYVATVSLMWLDYFVWDYLPANIQLFLLTTTILAIAFAIGRFLSFIIKFSQLTEKIHFKKFT